MFAYRMPFGKHRGQLVHEMPIDYLAWLRANVDMQEPLRTAVDLAWKMRTAPPPPPEPSPPVTGIDAAKLRELRRRLSLRFHPDRGGSTAEQRVVNVVLDELEAVR